ncbi:DUF1992 domain-containing protein [Arthrobacter sp. zg-Y1219]|uniref:DnaJ family domain-containing protein n=1 Tax=Arthrobacter sp. zg-Y1219 TaxID=3049067 RepID=UPI0024C3AA2E|nr:DUF1992 domain-containing protein [Arthrobacter sp. zg-Y1219]MDK1360397.1 DUF1992 domain-containing protein [Arthrobacter sp. zg-Y1219]
MGGSGAEAYKKRLERAARLKAAGTPEDAGYKLPEGLAGAEEAELAEKRRKISAEAKADYLIRDAMNRGDFDNLSYAGKPIPDLADPDPDWWIKRLIRRENLSGLGPPALLLRVEDKEFEPRLDRLPSERQVRDAVDDFNARVIEARRQLLGGPPVVTGIRNVEDEVRGWRQRRGLPETAPGNAGTKQPGAGTEDAAAQRPAVRGGANPPGWLHRLRRRLPRLRPGSPGHPRHRE